jgi:hypothetical protein
MVHGGYACDNWHFFQFCTTERFCGGKVGPLHLQNGGATLQLLLAPKHQ